MIIIGEQINATRKVIAEAIANRNPDLIVGAARRQVDAGADYIDINGGDPNPEKEIQNIIWLVEMVQDNVDAPVSVDTADAEAARAALSRTVKKPILNSISLETQRMDSMLPLLEEFDCTVIALLMDDTGIPRKVDERIERTEKIIDKLTAVGKKLDEIIIDPCILPISTVSEAGRNLMREAWIIRDRWPEVHIGGGLSNISYGLPHRRLINIVALTQAIVAGMDAAIIDPCTRGIIPAIYAAEAVAGNDDFCMNYVTAAREGKLG